MMNDFETHITLSSDAPIEDLRAVEAARGMKFTHILLDRGQTPSQPMVTRHGSGTLDGELAAAMRDARQLAQLSITVVRVKVEVGADDPIAPATDDDASHNRPDQYFEAHVKLLLHDDTDVSAATTLARRHRAHVSRNARRSRDDGRQERFVTYRGHRVGRATAAAAVDALLDDLRRAGYTVLDVEQEFVVYDSNLAVDAGWSG